MSTDRAGSLPDRLDAGAFELRHATAEYVDRILEAVAESLDELRPWMEWAQSLPSAQAMTTYLDGADESFRVNRDWMYLLIDKETGNVAGSSGLHSRIGPRGLEIGYWVRTSFTGRGYATQTAKILTDAAFTYLDWVDRIEIHMDQANVASVAVPRKLGFTLVREEVDRPIVTPGHSGLGYVWSLERTLWRERSHEVAQ
jgi:RimJ/RimL family protein N-acetyltransferase